MTYKILFLGHSFITRFKSFLREHQADYSFTLNLSPQQVMIQYSGRPGGTVPRINADNLEIVTDFEPHVVLLEFDTNDLCNANCSPASVASNIFRLANYLMHEKGVCKVIVMQILHRVNPRKAVRYRVDIDWFNARVDECNKTLVSLLTGHASIRFWKHKGLWRQELLERAILPDGVHLSSAGYRKYFKNVRAAVVSAKKDLSGV